MAKPRKYTASDSPIVGGAIQYLDELSTKLHDTGLVADADACKEQSDNLYAYLARNLQRRGAGRTEVERKARNQSILLRGYQKRIAELEEKLLLIRISTDLMEKGVTPSGGSGGIQVRMKRRIDHLEAKLLIIRELTDTTVGKRKDSAVPDKERQIHDARIKVDVEKGLRGRLINPIKAKLLESEVNK